MRINLITRTVFLLVAIVGMAVSGLVIGATDSRHPALPTYTKSYCVKVGDDNCDGMIIPTESGWICVPPNGGPLLCNVGE